MKLYYYNVLCNALCVDESACQEGVFAQNEASESSGVVSFSCEPQRTTFSLEVVLVEDARRVRVFQGKGQGYLQPINICSYIHSIHSIIFTYYIVYIYILTHITLHTLHTYIHVGLCLYVRREIRGLSKSDLATFLDASHVLWEIEDGPGQLKFGEDFHSNSFLLGFHQVG